MHAQVGVQLVRDLCATWQPTTVYPNMQMSPCTLTRRPLNVQIKMYRFSERPPRIGTEGSFLSIFNWTNKINLLQQQNSHMDALKEIICCQYNDQASNYYDIAALIWPLKQMQFSRGGPRILNMGIQN
jgi:hypothetical protein